MKLIFDERQLAHDPALYFRRGAFIPHPEQPERAILLRDALTAAGHARVSPRDHGLEPIYAVHDRGFVDFCFTAWDDWKAATGTGIPAVPNYHTSRREARVPKGVIGKLGYYSTDTACPFVEGTATAIYWSAQTAIEAAARIMAGDERFIYALCRPPGHHAYIDATMGFCFFNNAAIAAQHLRQTFARVAVLDIDTHGGNGTSDIFYDRGDVLYVSIHTDPSDYTPFFTGYADETGRGDGVGATLNLILPPGAGVTDILTRLDEALAAIRRFGAEALVVSLGFDMAEDDPLSLVKMTGDGFAEAARRIAGLDLPTVLVQEGGYLGPSLSANAVTFLGAYDAASREKDPA
jgi:acetoin utilization deacetylase AcuC-like enzyme